VFFRATTAPLCDRHHVPMSFAAYEDNGVALEGYGYLCWQAGCGRWYDATIGYFDMMNGSPMPDPPFLTCPAHDVPLYEGQFDFLAEAAQLRCPQAYCPHRLVQSAP
jgi:hypothetical protein